MEDAGGGRLVVVIVRGPDADDLLCEDGEEHCDGEGEEDGAGEVAQLFEQGPETYDFAGGGGVSVLDEQWRRRFFCFFFSAAVCVILERWFSSV